MNSLRPEKKWKTKLSSAGLIFCHFGEEIIKLLMKDISENALNVIYDMVMIRAFHIIVQKWPFCGRIFPDNQSFLKYNS